MEVLMILICVGVAIWFFVEAITVLFAFTDGADDKNNGYGYRNNWRYLRAYGYEFGYQYRTKHKRRDPRVVNREKFNR